MSAIGDRLKAVFGSAWHTNSNTALEQIATEITNAVAAPPGNVTLADGDNIVAGTATGSQIGTATTQKFGFYGATPIVQPAGAAQAAVTDNSGGAAAPTTGVDANVAKQTVLIPVQLIDFANAAAFKLALPFAFTVTSIGFRTGRPASTGGKAGNTDRSNCGCCHHGGHACTHHGQPERRRHAAGRDRAFRAQCRHRR